MKKLPFLALSCFVLFLVSCGNSSKITLLKTSPDKQIKITILAERDLSLEPWKVKLSVQAYDFKEGSLAFQIYATDITDENVKLEWQDKYHCLITFEESDKKLRKFQLRASENQVILGEVE
jgi:hypothetical protein